jgi:parallel beta-helix repeat protein
MAQSTGRPWNATILSVLLALLPFLGLLAVPAAASGPTIYVPHAPISINGNGGFTAANGVVRGSGTPSNPFVIEGWEIASSATDAIAIRNTEAYFVIRNVYLHSRSPGSSYADGIYFAFVANAVIEGSIIGHEWAGMGIWYSSNIVVRGNRVTENGLAGILLCHSTNVVVNGNLARRGEVGIFLIRAFDITVTGNEVSGNRIGMQFFDSGSVAVKGNNLLENAVPAEDRDATGNAWDGGYPSGGNYWSNYQGVDLFGGADQMAKTGPDGIGDSPMVFAGGQDRYPFMRAFASPVVPPGSEPQVYGGSPWIPAVLVAVALGAMVSPVLAGFLSRGAAPGRSLRPATAVEG